METVADLTPDEHETVAKGLYCRDCGHERDVNAANIPLPGDTPVPEVGKCMKCFK